MIFQHTNTNLTGTTRYYLLTFESGEGKEIEVSVSTSWSDGVDLMSIENIEFISGHEDLTEKQKEEIDSWIYDNLGDWTNEGE